MRVLSFTIQSSCLAVPILLWMNNVWKERQGDSVGSTKWNHHPAVNLKAAWGESTENPKITMAHELPSQWVCRACRRRDTLAGSQVVRRHLCEVQPTTALPGSGIPRQVAGTLSCRLLSPKTGTQAALLWGRAFGVSRETLGIKTFEYYKVTKSLLFEF